MQQARQPRQHVGPLFGVPPLGGPGAASTEADRLKPPKGGTPNKKALGASNASVIFRTFTACNGQFGC